LSTRAAIIVGAGCTLSDAMNVPLKKRPPLDRGFFSQANRVGHSELSSIKNYLMHTYDFNPISPETDSLEEVMAIIYADMHNPVLGDDALEVFRLIIGLFNKRIAETTNGLYPTNRSKLYRILCNLLDDKIQPDQICIITFNQDIQIEKTLEKLQSTGRSTLYGRIFNFPFCYSLTRSAARLTKPTGRVQLFQKGLAIGFGVRVLKLHGSLNWFSIHRSRDISRTVILNTARKLFITPRKQITLDMKYIGANRTEYTFPLVIPPVTHKAGILHEDLHRVWDEAEDALKEARRIIVFGYSCPANDFESANLIRRCISQNTNLSEFSVIDPNSVVFQRYVELTGLDSLYYFKTTESYLQI